MDKKGRGVPHTGRHLTMQLTYDTDTDTFNTSLRKCRSRCGIPSYNNSGFILRVY